MNGIVREEHIARERFDAKCVDVTPSGCRIWMGSVNENGYGTVCINQKKYKSHRVAWMFEYGEIPKGFLVLHQCDVPSCVNPNHLFLGNQRDNMRDMARKGRGGKGGARGERQGSAKLTQSDVRSIRKLARKGKTQQEIADLFKIDRSNVSIIVLRKGWRHVPD